MNISLNEGRFLLKTSLIEGNLDFAHKFVEILLHLLVRESQDVAEFVARLDCEVARLVKEQGCTVTSDISDTSYFLIIAFLRALFYVYKVFYF